MISAERLSEGLLQGFISVDSAWRVTFLNERARYLLRKPRLQPGLQLQDLIPDSSGGEAWSKLQQAMQTRKTVQFEVFYPSLFRRHEVVVIADEEGGLALLFQDVTDRQWSIEKDREHAYLRNLFQDAPVAVSIMRGPKHEFEYSNDFAQSLVGGRALNGLTVSEAFPELQGQGYFELLDEVYRSGKAFHGQDMPAVLTDPATGETTDLVVNNSYIPFRGFDDKINGILAVTVDITSYAK